MSAEARKALGTYRSLLRAVDAYVTRVNGNTMWREHIRSEFRRNASCAEPEAGGLLQLAEEYAYLLRCVHEHKASDQAIDSLLLLAHQMSHDLLPWQLVAISPGPADLPQH